MSTHEGLEKTLSIEEGFLLERDRKGSKKFVRECAVCQVKKTKNVAPADFVSPLPIPNLVWQDIALDFIEGLPKSDGETIVFVVVDRLSKFADFIPSQHFYSVPVVAKQVFEQVFKLYGMPQSIVCDPVFVSLFWQLLFRLQGGILMSSSYHLQTDDQSEAANKSLEMYLRFLTGDSPKSWSR